MEVKINSHLDYWKTVKQQGTSVYSVKVTLLIAQKISTLYTLYKKVSDIISDTRKKYAKISRREVVRSYNFL